jgi:hypothetical protein
MTFHPTEEHIPTTHAPEEPTAPRPREEEGGGGGGKGQYPTDDIHSTGTGISGTAGRIREISTNVGNVSIDSRSFGALNEEFSTTAQQHVQTTQQHVEATSKEVDAAADATHSTASSYQTTEENNTKLFTDIQNGQDGTGSQRTAPEGTTNSQPDTTAPATASPADPPADPTTSAPSGATTTPSGTSAPADPRAVTPGGPPPPSGPPSAGVPPPHSPPAVTGGPPSRPSWRDEINDPRNFTPDEQAKINDALHKMAQDPEPGKVAGAGALTPEQRELMGRVQKLVTIDPDTPMQKAMPQGSANDYLGNVTRTRAVDGYDFDPNSMSGFVARQQDGTNLHSNGDVIQGNRLDYPHTRFNVADPNEPVYVMRYPADDPSRYSTPLGAPYSDAPGMLGQHDPAVQGTADDMTNAAHSAGISPDDYHREVNPWPYSGIGVTADENLGLPERVMSPGPVPDGAEMYSYDQYGNQTLVGRYDEATGRWTDLRPSSAP